MAGEKELFREIWEKRDHISEISGEHLGNEAKAHFFAHIIPKGGYPGFRLREDNIVLMTMEEHHMYDHATHKAKQDVRFDWVFEVADKLKAQYNRRFSITASGYHVDTETDKVFSKRYSKPLTPRVSNGRKQVKMVDSETGKPRWEYIDSVEGVRAWYEHNRFIDYLADDGFLQSSHIKDFSISPLKYKSESKKEGSESSDAQHIGTAVHSAVMTPHLFEKGYAEGPGYVDMRLKYSKPSEGRYSLERWNEIRASEGVDFLLSRDEWSKVKAMQRNALLDPVFRMLLPFFDFIEVSFYVEDGENKLKSRPDIITKPIQRIRNRHIGGRIWIDVKTTKDASPKGFMREIIKYRYDMSAVHHGVVAEAAMGEPIASYWILAIENEPPYDANMYCIDDWYDQALSEYKHWLFYYNECRKKDVWPGYRTFTDEDSGIADIKCPEYFKNRILPLMSI
jgi:hypothetical protein